MRQDAKKEDKDTTRLSLGSDELILHHSRIGKSRAYLNSAWKASTMNEVFLNFGSEFSHVTYAISLT